jgi:hypothetical protein
MRVRLRRDADGDWRVESKSWFDFLCGWKYETYCAGTDAYDRAYSYAMALKYPVIEEIT